jgi:very-short-patch-repair endonuclease
MAKTRGWHPNIYYVPKRPQKREVLEHFAAENRLNSTAAEDRLATILLEEVRENRLNYIPYRQHVVANRWIVDLYFPDIRLAVEVDGSIHETEQQKARDRAKDAACAKADISVLRVSNKEVFGNRADLLARINEALGKALRPQEPSGSPRRGGLGRPKRRA